MRIVIDMQGAQSIGSKNRGIGRYSRSLVKAMVRQSGHEFILALNGMFPETILEIRELFSGLLPQENILVWRAPGPVAYSDIHNSWRRKSAELLREAFFTSLKPDFVVITNLFEGHSDNTVTSIKALNSFIPTACVLYDLIPLLNRGIYLNNSWMESFYENKLGHIFRADLLLAISESSKREGIQYLGFDERQCISISTASDPQFRHLHLSHQQIEAIRQRYGLSRSFVMYTGGIDYRKNIEGLVRAYAKLPDSIRKTYQLAVVCSARAKDKKRLRDLARKCNLNPDEFVLTGFVPEDDLIALYNLCALFVFPSWHEGFGLPVLEAMSCGCAVIASNNSSLPEVVGRSDALFDPYDDDSITQKIAQVLENNDFRCELETYGLAQSQKFSWDISARCALDAMQSLHQEKTLLKNSPNNWKRQRLAYISPLPPERSGISDYSAELLPELSRFYDIDVIVAQPLISIPWINANCSVRTVEWFRQNHLAFERVLYHFGNSSFHQHMFDLLSEIPGIVVLHDFFLANIIAHMDVYGLTTNFWPKSLYASHGYVALKDHAHASHPHDVISRYPCNLEVINNAQSVIVHSEHSISLAQQWYGNSAAKNLNLIPLLRVPVTNIEQLRLDARKRLNFDNDATVVCSFGLLGPTKLNYRLLDSWLASRMANEQNCTLIFVGENPGGEYAIELLKKMSDVDKLNSHVHITGWVEPNVFRDYLCAADIAVQLRTLSRGETSAAVLDCMNYGIPTIVNANGSMAYLPDDAVVKIADEFSDDELISALENLWKDKQKCQVLKQCSQEVIRKEHAPRLCAERYFSVIEDSVAASNEALFSALSSLDSCDTSEEKLLALAQDINCSIPPNIHQKQLLVDISELIISDVKTGIQRVVKSVLQEWINNPPNGYKVEPVYLMPGEANYFYARCFSTNLVGFSPNLFADEAIHYRNGDVFLGLDLNCKAASFRDIYQTMREFGVLVKFVVYDLIPLKCAHFFHKDSDLKNIFLKWLNVVAESDGAICISKSVSDELSEWFSNNHTHLPVNFKNAWFHLGADVQSSLPTTGLPDDSDAVLSCLQKATSFLMVGTIEPRKGYAQVLNAFEQLWSLNDENIILVIVGKHGWCVEELIHKLRHHPELGHRLFWLEGISDEYLEKIYTASTSLIAASEREGFGLPLIEAAQHKLPIIARDIPVFREVSAEHAYYFDGKEPEDIADAIRNWIALHRQDKAPKSDSMQWLTWKQSAQQLFQAIISE